MDSWNAVMQDMLERNEVGAKKYNKYLNPNTSEDMIQHAYEEALDLAVYLKTLIMQRDQTTEKVWDSIKREYYFYEC